MNAAGKAAIFLCALVLAIGAVNVPLLGQSSAYAGYKKIQLNVKGMKNYASINDVKEALEKVKGVKKTYVDFRNERAIVTVKKGTDPDKLIKAVKKAGFRAYLAGKVNINRGRRRDENPYDDVHMDNPIGP